MSSSPWDLLRAGQRDLALGQMREAFAQNQSPSYLMQLGVGYLWVGDHESASLHFDAANKQRPGYMDIYYAMAGAARWSVNDSEGAVERWRSGLNSQYSEGAGGITLPLLLFFASAMMPSTYARNDARNRLRLHLKDSRISNWPGSLAALICGVTNVEAIKERWSEEDSSSATVCHLLTDFYWGVLEYERGEVEHFKQLMRRTATTTHDDFDTTKRQFLVKLWHPEFFLARHEAHSVTIEK